LSSLTWIPHFSSIINWTLRVGLWLLESVAQQERRWVAIVDTSVSLGFQKILVVLRVPLSVIEVRKGAISLEDCECIACERLQDSTAQNVCLQLGKAFGKAGFPSAIIRDGGTDLKCGIELWKKSSGSYCEVIYDIGHRIACILKAYLEGLRRFQAFKEAVLAAAKRFGASEVAFLKPPTLRQKGRYLSITKFFDWAKNVMPLFAGTSKWRKDPLAKRLVEILPGFGAHRAFLSQLTNTLSTAQDVLQILKTEGLNQSTASKIRSKIEESLSSRNPVGQKILLWLKKHLQAQCRLSMGQTPLPVSSDAIESLFGKLKRISELGGSREFNRMVAIIPCLCGKRTESQISDALNSFSHTKLQTWQTQCVPQTQRQKRRLLFPPKRSSKVPKTAFPSTA
jgi:hypothetical protein